MQWCNALLASYRLCRRKCYEDTCVIFLKSMYGLGAALPLAAMVQALSPQVLWQVRHRVPSGLLRTVASSSRGLEKCTLQLQLDVYTVFKEKFGPMTSILGLPRFLQQEGIQVGTGSQLVLETQRRAMQKQPLLGVPHREWAPWAAAWGRWVQVQKAQNAWI